MSNSQRDAILPQRFAPFDFSNILGFPNVVPTMDEWGYILHIFREDEYYSPMEPLLSFHELMHQFGIKHEDVLMKMFIYSLREDPHEWYKSLPPSIISSLK